MAKLTAVITQLLVCLASDKRTAKKAKIPIEITHDKIILYPEFDNMLPKYLE